MRRYSLVCDDSTAERIEAIAAEYGLTEQEVLGQLIEVGLEAIDHRQDVSRG